MLLTAGVLSLAAAVMFVARLQRLDGTDPARLIGQLRLAQWVAVALAMLGGAPIGLAVVTSATDPLAHLDLALGIGFVLTAGLVLHRDPVQALRLAAAGFMAHALVQIAHGRGWLTPGLAPMWFIAGCASYDVALAAVCFWAARRARP